MNIIRTNASQKIIIYLITTKIILKRTEAIRSLYLILGNYLIHFELYCEV